MSERRFQRSPMDAPIRVMIGQREVLGRTRDISLCGLFITLPAPWPPLEDSVRIAFALPESGREVELVARIVRHQPEASVRQLHPGIGVEFVNLPADILETIEGFVVGRFRSLRFLKRLLDDPQTAEGHIQEFIRAFGLELSGSRSELQSQVEERLRFFRMRPAPPA